MNQCRGATCQWACKFERRGRLTSMDLIQARSPRAAAAHRSRGSSVRLICPYSSRELRYEGKIDVRERGRENMRPRAKAKIRNLKCHANSQESTHPITLAIVCRKSISVLMPGFNSDKVTSPRRLLAIMARRASLGTSLV